MQLNLDGSEAIRKMYPGSHSAFGDNGEFWVAELLGVIPTPHEFKTSYGLSDLISGPSYLRPAYVEVKTNGVDKRKEKEGHTNASWNIYPGQAFGLRESIKLKRSDDFAQTSFLHSVDFNPEDFDIYYAFVHRTRNDVKPRKNLEVFGLNFFDVLIIPNEIVDEYFFWEFLRKNGSSLRKETGLSHDCLLDELKYVKDIVGEQRGKRVTYLDISVHLGELFESGRLKINPYLYRGRKDGKTGLYAWYHTNETRLRQLFVKSGEFWDDFRDRIDCSYEIRQEDGVSAISYDTKFLDAVVSNVKSNEGRLEAIYNIRRILSGDPGIFDRGRDKGIYVTADCSRRIHSFLLKEFGNGILERLVKWQLRLDEANHVSENLNMFLTDNIQGDLFKDI